MVNTFVSLRSAPAPGKNSVLSPRAIAQRLKNRLIATASKNGFLASLYFTVASRRFYREHCAVLAGQARYRSIDLARISSFGGFRRNVHRLEKALVMQPRRDSFAEDYISNTVSQFAQAKGGQIDAGELKWAGDILNLYFSVVKDTPRIAAARRAFEAIGYKGISSAPSIPYPKADIAPSGLAFEELRKLFIERRSVRWFDDRPVSMEILDKAIEAAGWAPTACNRQPYCFHVFSDREQVMKVAGLAGGTAGFLENIRCVIVVVGDLSNYIEERDRHLIYIDGSLAAMQLMLALQTLGLSSVPINWPDVEDRETRMQQELGLSSYERPVMLVGVGYGSDTGYIPYSQKKPIHLISRKH